MLHYTTLFFIDYSLRRVRLASGRLAVTHSLVDSDFHDHRPAVKTSQHLSWYLMSEQLSTLTGVRCPVSASGVLCPRPVSCVLRPCPVSCVLCPVSWCPVQVYVSASAYVCTCTRRCSCARTFESASEEVAAKSTCACTCTHTCTYLQGELRGCQGRGFEHRST